MVPSVGAIGDQHPSVIGLDASALGRDEVRAYGEGSDCVLLLRALLTGLNLGGFTARLDPARCIHATRGRLQVGYHVYGGVRPTDVVEGPANADLSRPVPIAPLRNGRPNALITVERLVGRPAVPTWS